MPRGRRPSSSNRSSSRPRASSSNPTASRSGSAHRQSDIHLQALNNGNYDEEIIEILRGRDGVVENWSEVAARIDSTPFSGKQVKARYPFILDAPARPFLSYIDEFKRELERAGGGTAASASGVRGDDAAADEGDALAEDDQDGPEDEGEEGEEDEGEGMES